jgi:hypothetical protein
VTYKTKNSQLSHGLSIASATLFDPEAKEQTIKPRNKASSCGRYTAKETEILHELSVGDSKPFFVSLLDMSAFAANPSLGYSTQKGNFSIKNTKKTDSFFTPFKYKRPSRHATIISQTPIAGNHELEDKQAHPAVFKYPAFSYRNNKPNHLKYYKYLQKKHRSYPEKSTAVTPLIPDALNLEITQNPAHTKLGTNASGEIRQLGETLETLEPENSVISQEPQSKIFLKQSYHYKALPRTKVYEKRQVDKLKEVNIHDIELPSFSTNDSNMDAATQTIMGRPVLKPYMLKKRVTNKRDKPDGKFHSFNRYLSSSPQGKLNKSENEVINNSINL